MRERLGFLVNRLREKLWIRPLLMCALALIGAGLAKSIEYTPLARLIPNASRDSVETLLTILSGSMLVIATFAVGSMVSSFASASSNATPRTFPLVVADDVSQNALSIFVGAFIFSLISLLFLKNDVYDDAGLSALLALTIVTFATVIVTFVRWVDSIARLGRLGTTIDKATAVTARALQQRRIAPTLGCRPLRADTETRHAVYSSSIGYVQRVDVESLQHHAQQCGLRIALRSLPGTFVTRDRVLAHVTPDDGEAVEIDRDRIEGSFLIGDRRTFDEDPRFGLIVLSEIASRALSAAVNDPGTAIDVIGALVRLFTTWSEPVDDEEQRPCVYDRIEAPELCPREMFDDAFTAIARDGAGCIEVAARLQKALRSLASIGNPGLRDAAVAHSRMALERAEHALHLPADLDIIRGLGSFSSRI